MAGRNAELSQTKTTLGNDIWSACDILRRDNNCGGIMEYVEHLAWLLFLKFLDSQEEEWETQAKINKEKYHRILDGPYRWREWAKKDWPAEELLRFVNGDLIPHLQNLQGDPVRDTIRGVFSDRNVIVCASGYNLKDVIQILDRIDFNNHDDVFTVSQVYEDLLRRLGNENRMAGEFYTPRPVIRFIIDVIDPRIGETVYDPACGSCGFLAQSYEKMKGRELSVDDYETLQQRTFFGQEKKAVPALLGALNLVLHGVTAPKVYRRNTLEENIRQPSERYDAILTNPPFGGTEGRHIQDNFPVKANATELLFLEHIMKKLKPHDGARCGMVVPEGTLFRGGAFAVVKKDLLEAFNLFLVVSLPPGTFSPYSDVKAALIFFQRPGPTKEVLYYEMPLPAGLKKFSKGSPIADEHFSEVRAIWAKWKAFREGTGRKPKSNETSWVETAVSLASKQYDLSAKNPHHPEAEDVPSPVELTSRLLERNRELKSVLERLHEFVINGEEK
jgi:type I restriction enzyme M protein